MRYPKYKDFLYAYLVALAFCGVTNLSLFPLILIYVWAFPAGFIMFFNFLTDLNLNSNLLFLVASASFYALYFYIAYAGVSRGSRIIFAAFVILLMLNVIGCRMMTAEVIRNLN